ncbi:MAG: acyl-CoA transferase, partial [Pseudomonadota bacterium]|nr:acyl-CoA transferase [Pseudomonadota bacterium]
MDRARSDDQAAAQAFLAEIWAALGGDPARAGAVRFRGEGALRSSLPVSDLAAGSVGAAALAAADFREASGGPAAEVWADRRLASLWFRASIRPGWETPPAWDALAGDYATAD